MRILIGSLIFATSVLLSQSSQDFHNRYGEPDRERFAARPEITLTVEHGSDHQACYALIDPPQPLLYSQEHVPLMSSEGVSEVLEEVRPCCHERERDSDVSDPERLQSKSPDGLRERFDNAFNTYLRHFESRPGHTDCYHF